MWLLFAINILLGLCLVILWGVSGGEGGGSSVLREEVWQWLKGKEGNGGKEGGKWKRWEEKSWECVEGKKEGNDGERKEREGSRW